MVYKALNMTLSFFYCCPFSKTREYISYVIRTKPHQSVMNKTGKYLIFFLSFIFYICFYLSLMKEKYCMNMNIQTYLHFVYTINVQQENIEHTHRQTDLTHSTLSFALHNRTAKFIWSSCRGGLPKSVCACVFIYIQQIS